MIGKLCIWLYWLFWLQECEGSGQILDDFSLWFVVSEIIIKSSLKKIKFLETIIFILHVNENRQKEKGDL